MKKTFHYAAIAGISLFGISAAAAAVIYEPFAYSGTLAGNGGAETGLTGTWTANNTAIGSGSLAWGDLEVGGNKLGPTSGGQNLFTGARSVSASALSTSGLLNDGTELWFSVLMGYGVGGNRTNSRLAFVLGTDSLNGANFRYNYTVLGATGLGVTLGRFSAINGKIVATQIRDTTFGNSGFAGNVFGNEGAAILPGANTNEDFSFVVGRITWGALSDTIDIFLPDSDLNLGAIHSSLTVNVDQSGYDTISMARGDVMVMDEIRFGASFADVSPVPASVVIPEPSTALLGALGALAFLRRRR